MSVETERKDTRDDGKSGLLNVDIFKPLKEAGLKVETSSLFMGC